ncbi:FIST N-terminal domain-containing protein [Crocosphaera sp. XPORK-15E]|nr:FIST N-terminal domain-containing protein [Crocosphaera sp. XPORK-15E]MEA5536589.1 FIST N-terminal domain-containing protein [Crocosphaera sp. XPORK-15E]
MTDHSSMQWTNALSTRPSLEGAVTEVVEKIKQSLSHPPDLGIVFISSAYASDYTRLVPLILEKLPLPVLIGCGGAGIIGQRGQAQAQEVENNPALSLSVGYLPDVTLQPFLLNESLPDLDSSPETWHQLLGVSPQQRPDFILLADAFSTRINDLLEGLDFAYPDSIKVGGLTSSSVMGVPSALFYHTTGDQGSGLYHQGTVGLALSGNIEVEAIVAQGCRPIGQPYQVVRGERNVILELSQDGNIRPPLDLLRDLIETLNESDRQLAQHSLFIGIVRDEFQEKLQSGDFLIRNLLGVDPRLGAIAIGDQVRPGQRIQFHLRDAQTSAEDLEILLKNHPSSSNLSTPIKGALMFACLGRGQNLYSNENFDSELFSSYFPEVPLGGFFCNGEIGPVGKETFLHGYTSAFALFRQPG